MNRFNISTVWCIKNNTWNTLLKQLKSIGFSKFELNVEVPENWFNNINKSVLNNEVEISGLHNFCPALEYLPEGKNYYNVYSITSDNTEERNLAIEYTKKTIKFAKYVNAKYIVMHPGEVKIEMTGEKVNSFAYKFGTKVCLYEKYKNECIKQRQQHTKHYLDNLFFGLEQILNYAVKNNIFIGLENRFYYHEIPIPEDLDKIFNKFNDIHLGYWHDIGHCEVNKRLGFFNSHHDFLKPFKNKLIGMHLHDVKGLEDHFAPGTGEVDFNILKQYIHNGLFLTIEVHPKVKITQLKDGVKFLNKIIL